MTFEELGLHPNILQAVQDLGFVNCMPVQEQAIPHILYNDINLVALAQTGTGKTAAFGLPILNNIACSTDNVAYKTDDKKDMLHTTSSILHQTSALIIAPTRELCIQIANDCKKFAKYLPQIKIVPVYGGASIEQQIKELKKGADIIVATPGRLIDLLDRKKVKLGELKYLVLDEADEMLNMGFKEDLDNIFVRTPQEKNIYMFSATMPREVEQIAENYIDNPVKIQIGQRNQGSENVKHFYYLVHQKDRYLALKRIADYYPDIYAIVFCRTKVQTQEVADMLIKDGYNADSLHGDLSQAQRDHVMSRFRLRNIQLLVATDVAARGLDVNNLTHVINYELPDELEQYVHRSGRTGRADKQGISIAIINLKQKKRIKALENILKKSFQQAQIPTAKDVCKKQLFNLINRVENVDTSNDEIDAFIPEITKKLSWLSREDLIKHFVSLEFEELLKYYKDAPDLNVDEAAENEKQRREDKQRAKLKGKSSRQRDFNKEHFATLCITVGYKDKIVPQRLIGMINEYTPSKRIEIGKIDINNDYTYIEVSDDGAEDVIDALNGRRIRGKEIFVDYKDLFLQERVKKTKKKETKQKKRR
ncbi:MAG: DEAD/DEAH box helicase [Bacteroidales bacterium]|nr:DEAD/DEAH box helicase [Bacteroidales bacterium]